MGSGDNRLTDQGKNGARSAEASWGKTRSAEAAVGGGEGARVSQILVTRKEGQERREKISCTRVVLWKKRIISFFFFFFKKKNRGTEKLILFNEIRRGSILSGTLKGWGKRNRLLREYERDYN